MSEIVGIIESVGPTIVIEVMDAGPEGKQGIQGEKGDGWTDAYYTPGTGKITFESDDGLGFVTDDLRGDKGDVGDMWKPSIDENGTISWSQSSSTTAPTPTNIRGPIGVAGAKPSHAWDGTKLQFENPDGSMGNKVDLKGLKGDTGDVWKPTVNASGIISWTKDSSATAPTERDITGPQGLKGDKPAHSWAGTILTIENPDGTPGTPVNLQGPQGNVGPAPTINYPTLAGEIDYDELSDSLDAGSIADILMGDAGFKASVKGDTGDTWKPAVNATTGLLTWSKDSGTPSSVNIKGPQGDPGTQGVPGNTWKPSVDAAGNLTWSTASGTPSSANIKGPKGDDGSDAPATPVVNALNSTSTTSALSANQGKVLNEGKASATEVIIVVKHGTNGNTARPVGASVVYWVGSAEPTKALNDDMWLGEE